MKLPRPAWFSIEDLAEEWGCSVSKVKKFLDDDTNPLTLSARFTHEEFSDAWGSCFPEVYADYCATLTPEGYKFEGEYILLATVERFEKECCLEGGGVQDMKKKKREEFVKSLLAKKENKDVIAARLKHEFGATAWEIVGLLDIAPHLSNLDSRKTEARRAVKRGDKILAKRALPK